MLDNEIWIRTTSRQFAKRLVQEVKAMDIAEELIRRECDIADELAAVIVIQMEAVCGIAKRATVCKSTGGKQDMNDTNDLQPYEPRAAFEFSPNDHLIQIPSSKGKTDYLPVQWRLVWFRLICPQGTIDTEEIEVDNDRECEAEVSAWNNETRRSEKVLKRAPGYARYRAVVTDGKGGRASATKTERKVDFDDFVEKAETGAVGRALAMLGYGTQFAMIEFDEGERIVDAPVQRPATPYQERRAFVEADKPAPEPPITDQQKASMRKLSEHLDLAFDEEKIAAMPYQQAKDAIVDLSAKYNEMKRGTAKVSEAPQANGQQEPEQPALSLGRLFLLGKEYGLWAETSVGKLYTLASKTLGVPIDSKSKPSQAQLLQLQAAIIQEVSAGSGK